MITIRRLTYDLPDNGDTIMTHLKFDTEKVNFGLADFFVRWPIEMDKPWIGDVGRKDFRIIRARTGLLKLNTSRILLAGQIINEEKEERLELRLGLPGYQVLIILLFWAIIFFAAFTSTYFQGAWGPLIASSLSVSPILFTIRDMKRTEAIFDDYLESVEATSFNTVHNASMKS